MRKGKCFFLYEPLWTVETVSDLYADGLSAFGKAVVGHGNYLGAAGTYSGIRIVLREKVEALSRNVENIYCVLLREICKYKCRVLRRVKAGVCIVKSHVETVRRILGKLKLRIFGI